MKSVVLSGAGVGVGEAAAVARDGAWVDVAPGVLDRLAQARQVLDRVDDAARQQERDSGRQTGRQHDAADQHCQHALAGII